MGNEKTKEDYRELAIAYVSNGNNKRKAAEKAGYDKTNASRLFDKPAVQEAIEEARKEIVTISGCTKEFVIDLLKEWLTILNGRNKVACTADQIKIIETNLKIIKELNSICGHYAPTTSNQFHLTSNGKDLANIIEAKHVIKDVPAKEV